MANKKRIRGSGEYNVAKTWEVHPDAVEAVDRMAVKFKPSYGAGVRKKLVTFGILFLEKELKERGIKPGEDIEEALGIQADQAGRGRQVHGQAAAGQR